MVSKWDKNYEEINVSICSPICEHVRTDHASALKEERKKKIKVRAIEPANERTERREKNKAVVGKVAIKGDQYLSSHGYVRTYVRTLSQTTRSMAPAPRLVHL